jgi:hypothetical protein
MTHPDHPTPDPTNAKAAFTHRELTRRTIKSWQRCDPKVMSTMSEAAIFLALDDARADILTLSTLRYAAPVAAVPGWISVEDRLPELGGSIAVVIYDKYVFSGKYEGNTNFGHRCLDRLSSRWYSFDLWHPLPAAAEVKS